jgi:uncharacterized protein
MRITVFGATGGVGSRVVVEARSRGHEVIAASRATGGDAGRLDDVVRLSRGRDVVISATRPVPGREHELAATAKVLMEGLRQTGVRLLLVGGAGSLSVAGGHTIEDAPDFPDEFRPIAAACTEQLAVCLAESEVD